MTDEAREQTHRRLVASTEGTCDGCGLDIAPGQAVVLTTLDRYLHDRTCWIDGIGATVTTTTPPPPADPVPNLERPYRYEYPGTGDPPGLK